MEYDPKYADVIVKRYRSLGKSVYKEKARNLSGRT